MTHVTQRSSRQSCIITRVESSGHARCYTTTTWTKAAMLQFDEIVQAPKAPFGYTDSYLITNNRCSTIPTTRDRIRFMVGFSKRQQTSHGYYSHPTEQPDCIGLLPRSAIFEAYFVFEQPPTARENCVLKILVSTIILPCPILFHWPKGIVNTYVDRSGPPSPFLDGLRHTGANWLGSVDERIGRLEVVPQA